MSRNPLGLAPACLKTISAVEASPTRSNQHEFNGVKALREMFGSDTFDEVANFSIRGQSTCAQVKVTWYNAREAHLTRTEYRLYFQTNMVMAEAQEGDNILVGYDNSRKLHIVLIKMGSLEHRPNVLNWEGIVDG